MRIQIDGVTKRFGPTQALDKVSLDIPDGELVALLGPSGCGKTTLLRIIAGLETPDAGEVRLGSNDTRDLAVQERRIGFVFQHYALFRHMTVRENIGFALLVQKKPKAEIRDRVDELLSLIQLKGMAERFPSQLSGGQKQRVALARALAARPQVLLLDEPFGALDAQVRKDLRRWLRKLHDEMHITSVFVTHDQDEAFEVSDRVAILNLGRVEQVGSPEEIFHAPANAFVMQFLGNVNIFHSRLEAGSTVHLEPSLAASTPGTREVYVRPHDLSLSRHREGPNSVEGKVSHIRTTGLSIRVTLTMENGAPLQIELPVEEFQALGLQKGDVAFATPREVKIFGEDYSI